jgi:hypothetical protein
MIRGAEVTGGIPWLTRRFSDATIRTPLWRTRRRNRATSSSISAPHLCERECARLDAEVYPDPGVVVFVNEHFMPAAFMCVGLGACLAEARKREGGSLVAPVRGSRFHDSA